MNQTKKYFIFGLAVCLLGLSGCQPKEESAPQIEKADSPRKPNLIASSPQAMDLISAQQTLSSKLSAAASGQHAAFFIQPHPTAELPTEKSGAKFEHAIELNGKTLTLRGVTIRKFEMSALSLLTIYSVALYLPAETDISGDIPDVEKVLILEYHLDVPKEKVVKAIRESVYANPDVSIPAVEADFQKLSAAFDSPKKGDRYEFPYIPQRGTAMIKSHEIMTLIQGRDFEQAFFGIWLSPHGNDLQMRCELLALPCPEKSILNPVNALSSGLGEAKEKFGKLKNLIS